VAGLSFDTAVLVALDRGDEQAWAWLRRAVDREVVPIVSTAAVAEAWRGGSFSRLRSALTGCEIVPVSDAHARVAGEAIAAVGASTVDAMIASTAAQAGTPLLTADPDDMLALSRHFRSLRVLTL
jgi:predicted nucleic acid-binding protein